jgi:hypothetical protein
MLRACSTYGVKGNRRTGYRILVVKPEGKNKLKDPDVDGKII